VRGPLFILIPRIVEDIPMDARPRIGWYTRNIQRNVAKKISGIQVAEENADYRANRACDNICMQKFSEQGLPLLSVQWLSLFLGV
jgi:hypothetical protein